VNRYMYRLGAIVKYDTGEYAMVIDVDHEMGLYAIRFLSDEEEMWGVVHGELEVVA